MSELAPSGGLRWFTKRSLDTQTYFPRLLLSLPDRFSNPPPTAVNRWETMDTCPGHQALPRLSLKELSQKEVLSPAVPTREGTISSDSGRRALFACCNNMEAQGATCQTAGSM